MIPEVKEEIIPPFFEMFVKGKSDKNYLRDFMEEQPALAMLLINIMEEFEQELIECKSKNKVIELCNEQMTGIAVMFYSLIKHQQELDEFKDLMET